MSKNKSINAQKTSDEGIQEDIRELVLARVMAASDDLRIAIGAIEYTKKEMIENIKEGNEIGREIMKIQMEYLRDMAKGAIYQSLNE